MVLFSSAVSLLLFCLLNLSNFDRVVVVSICSSRFIYFSLPFCGFWLMEFEALLLGACTLRITMSSWRIDPFNIMNTLLYLGQLSLLWCLLYGTHSFYIVLKFVVKNSLGSVFLLDPYLLISLIIQGDIRSGSWRPWEVFLN